MTRQRFGFLWLVKLNGRSYLGTRRQAQAFLARRGVRGWL